MNTKQIIDKWLDDTKKDLIINYDKLGLRASGKWAESLEEFTNISDGNFRIGILGKEYTGAIESGRRPNSNSSEEAIMAWAGWAGNTIIKDWVEDKGLDLNPFAVAYNIAKNGWHVPNKHNAGGLVTDVVTTARIADLNRQLSLFYVDLYKSEIIKDFK